MIFIVRTGPGRVPDFAIKMTRQTPDTAPDSAGRRDFFCLGDPEAAKSAGWPVVPVHDGWYDDDATGGMAIWGQGMFWEVRDTPFVVKEACGPEAWPADPLSGQTEDINLRQAIFRG
ncbi:MAG TPA: hypothetical protein VGF36_01575 [Rhodopila sp.]